MGAASAASEPLPSSPASPPATSPAVATSAPPVTVGSGIQRWVFWPAAVVVLAFSAFAIITPRAAEAMFAAIQSTIVNAFNWYYVLIAAFFVAAASQQKEHCARKGHDDRGDPGRCKAGDVVAG